MCAMCYRGAEKTESSVLKTPWPWRRAPQARRPLLRLYGLAPILASVVRLVSDAIACD